MVIKYKRWRGTHYRVGDDGSVWSKSTGAWKQLRLTGIGGGRKYLYVELSIKGIRKRYYVHRLVLWAFKGKCISRHECKWKNGDQSDNRLCNIYWKRKARRKICTRKDKKRFRLHTLMYNNAKNKGVPIKINWRDIPLPKVCKYLGCKLNYKRSKVGRKCPFNQASVDRIIPSKGYVTGNIQVISALANRMKNDATLEELVTFAEGVLKVHKNPKQISE